jgi:hypothetical protein
MCSNVLYPLRNIGLLALSMTCEQSLKVSLGKLTNDLVKPLKKNTRGTLVETLKTFFG